jgi:signal transduction histidine kinase
VPGSRRSAAQWAADHHGEAGAVGPGVVSQGGSSLLLRGRVVGAEAGLDPYRSSPMGVTPLGRSAQPHNALHRSADTNRVVSLPATLAVPFGRRLPRWRFGVRWALGVVLAVGLTVLVELPAVPREPFFVAINAAVVGTLVALGHYLVEQHGERFSGLCFAAAAGGWLLLNLDVHASWAALPSWLLGSGVVFIGIGCAVLHWGQTGFGGPGCWWAVICMSATVATRLPIALVSRPEWLGYSSTAWWPTVHPDRAAAAVLAMLAGFVFVGIAGYFARVALRRLHQATPVHRRILRPLTLAAAGWGGAAALLTAISTLAPGLLPVHVGTTVVGLASLVVTAALATAVNRGRMLAATFVEALPAQRTPEALTAHVRSALSDPTAELLFTVPDRPIMIDGAGRQRELPDPDRADRFVHWIDGSTGEPVAVLVGDPRLHADPAVVRSVAKVLAIVAENQQLHAVLRMQLGQVGALRAAERLAYDRARQQFRRDLHDGVQQTVAAARMDLDGLVDDLHGHPAVGTAAALDTVLRHALDQIRGLAGGLGPAINRTAAELRLDTACRIDPNDLGALTLPVYYLIREALTNAHKHARTGRVEIDVDRSGGQVDVVVRDRGVGGARLRPGGGLTGLCERVGELGGTLAVHSPPGGGTTLRARLPAVPA